MPSIRKTGSYSLQAEAEAKKIDHKGRPPKLSSPNYALASEIAAKAAQAVFEAVNRQGADWIKNKRLLMHTTPKGEFIFKPLGSRDFITSPEKLTQAINRGGYTRQSQLLDIIQACLDQIAKYWLHKE